MFDFRFSFGMLLIPASYYIKMLFFALITAGYIIGVMTTLYFFVPIGSTIIKKENNYVSEPDFANSGNSSADPLY